MNLAEVRRELKKLGYKLVQNQTTLKGDNEMVFTYGKDKVVRVRATTKRGTFQFIAEIYGKVYRVSRGNFGLELVESFIDYIEPGFNQKQMIEELQAIRSDFFEKLDSLKKETNTRIEKTILRLKNEGLKLEPDKK